jgi:hypothetical protein
MTKERILEIIKAEETELYNEFTELRETYGVNDKSTRVAAQQWNAVLTLLQKIEDENA